MSNRHESRRTLLLVLAGALSATAMAQSTAPQSAVPLSFVPTSMPAYEIQFAKPGGNFATGQSTYFVSASVTRVASLAKCMQDVGASAQFVAATCITADYASMANWYNGDGVPALSLYGPGVQSYGVYPTNGTQSIGAFVGVFSFVGREDYRTTQIKGFSSFTACITAAQSFVNQQYFPYPNEDQAFCIENVPNASGAASGYLVLPNGGFGQPFQEFNASMAVAGHAAFVAPLKAPVSGALD